MLKTNELVVLQKSKIIFGIVSGLFIILSSGFIYVGTETNQMQQKIIDPLKNIANELYEASQDENSGLDVDYEYHYEINVDTNTSTTVTTPSPTVTPVVYEYRYEYVYPTTPPRATIVPGEPGSKEWQEEFDRKWEEMSNYNDQKNKEVQEAQKKFCEENPDLCN